MKYIKVKSAVFSLFPPDYYSNDITMQDPDKHTSVEND